MNKKLTESLENYLETIGMLIRKNKIARVKDISKELDVKNSSVNIALNVLADKGLIIHEKYGYVDVPNDWVEFIDVDGTDSLQYSYAGVYIISMNVVNSNNTAKESASNFMYNMQQSTEVSGVTGATVTIGKNDEYTAYQIYMYYPADHVYLVTYWFEAEDGKVHYLALEGPDGIADYLSIPQSFRLKK